jgi:hypothetical protein
VGGRDDLRAWDGGIEAVSTRNWLLGVEAETRVGDIQDLQRRIQLKLRDDPALTGAILLLADTRHNRMVLKANLTALRSDFPIDGATALRALATGEHPGGSAIVLL